MKKLTQEDIRFLFNAENTICTTMCHPNDMMHAGCKWFKFGMRPADCEHFEGCATCLNYIPVELKDMDAFKKRDFTDEEEAIVREWVPRVGVNATADILYTSPRIVSRWCDTLGIEKKKGARRKYNHAAALKMLKNGASVLQVTKVFHISASAVYDLKEENKHAS